MIASEARGAWSEIEAKLRPYVTRRVASSADVDDILQEIFIRIHRGLANLHDGERFGSWVYRIAHNVIVDSRRALSREPFETVPEISERANADTDEKDVATLQADLGTCVALFVARLPSPYRAAITLTELEGLTHKEAADVLAITLSATKSRVQRGREKIREMFDECCRVSVDCRGRVVECEARPLEQVPGDCRATAASWAAKRRSV